MEKGTDESVRAVLFVDVDGVMHPVTGDDLFSPLCMAELARIQQQTKCRLVLSSSWRLKDETTALVNDALIAAGAAAAVDRTADLGFRAAEERFQAITV